MLVVLGFDHGQGDVGLVEQGIVDPEHTAFVAVSLVAAHHHAPSAGGLSERSGLGRSTLHAPWPGR